ncbi:hypothetical protein Tco_0195406 [Tanacetum coccineum]
MLKDDDSFALSLNFFSLSHLPRGPFYLAPPGVKIRSLTPTSPLRAGGFHRDGTFMDYPDLKPCAPWLCPFSDASYLQLHLGNPIS